MEPGGKIPGYVVTGKLGSGSDSEVYECVKKHDSLARKVAVKAIRKDQTPERLERARKEIEVLELLDHPNIVKLQEWFETDDALYIVLERAGGGDLFEVLYSHELNPTQTVLEEKCARRIFTQTALAVSYMHRQGVCHRDLKPENIFLDSEWNVKVGDFGLSHRYQPGRKVNDPVGSLIYASPEVLRRESYVGPELDAWSMGILLYEMLCGTPPFVGETERDLCRAILAGEYSVPDFVSPGARSLISKLVKLKHYRISMEEVLNHPWIMEGLPAAIAVQRRSRKRRGSIMSASSEETSNSPKSRQAPKETRKKRKEGSTRKSRKDQEASITLVAPDAESSVPSVTAAAPVAPVVGDAELAQRDLMTISAGDLAVVRAAVTAQTKPQILNDEEELATGGTESPVVSGTLSPAVLASDLPNPPMGPPKKQQLCDDDEEAGALSGHLQKLDLSRESFPAYSKTASLRETLSVPVPPLRSLSSPVVQF